MFSYNSIAIYQKTRISRVTTDVLLQLENSLYFSKNFQINSLKTVTTNNYACIDSPDFIYCSEILWFGYYIIFTMNM